MKQDELIARIALEQIPGIGNKIVKQLISYCGSASNVFKLSKGKLQKIPGIGTELVSTIMNNQNFVQAENIMMLTQKHKIDIIHYTHPLYPARLKQISDSPNILYKKGNGNLNPTRSLAIIGTRKATSYGKQITEKIVSDLMPFNVTVVSGLAYGIDIYAHKSCIENGIPTWAVLANGLDSIYPPVHEKYAEQMIETGGILSENIPGTLPNAFLFPSRNRIIAGMVDAVIVVEAAKKGGALITALIADSYNRIIFAVPGKLDKKFSEGTNHLLAIQKACIYTQITDLIQYMNWDMDLDKTSKKNIPVLNADEQVIYELLTATNQALEIDVIARKTQIPINQVASLLLELEFKNLLKSLPGKKYQIK